MAKRKTKKRRSNVSRRKKRTNPMRKTLTYKDSSGKTKSVSSAAMMTPTEAKKVRYEISKAKTEIKRATYEASKSGHSKTKKNALRKTRDQLKKELANIQADYKSKTKIKKSELGKIAALREDLQVATGEIAGMAAADKGKGSVSVKTVKWGEPKATKKKRKKRKKKVVKKKTKRKTKSKTSAKKKTRKKAAGRKKTTRRKKRKASSKSMTRASVYAGKRSTSAKLKTKKRLSKNQTARKSVKVGKKKYSVSVKRTNPKRRRKNPIGGSMIGAGTMGDTLQSFGLDKVGPIAQAFGPVAGQAGGLFLGGLVYGKGNQLMASIPVVGPMVMKAANSIPFGIGPAVPNLLAGSALYYLSKKNVPGAGVAAVVGQGLLAAAMVGIGVNASQSIAFFDAGTAGLGSFGGFGKINYTPGRHGQIPGSTGVNFGKVDFTPEMSGVDYTPDMGAVEFTPEMGTFNTSADFGEYQQSEADFGEIPQGLG